MANKYGEVRVADLVERRGDIVIEPPLAFEVDPDSTYDVGDITVTEVIGVKEVVSGTRVDGEYQDLSANAPLPVDGNSVYVQDIDFANSDFTDWVGDPEEMFRSPFSASIVNATADNPKQIILAFKRTVNALQIGFGENNGGSFSNLKVSLLGSGGATRSVYDESTDDTDRTSRNAEFENELFNSLLIEFYTADTVSLSNITIQRSAYNTAQIQGQRPDGGFATFQATRNGNFRVSVDEYGDTPSIDAFARLRTSEPYTIFDSKQLHDKQPLFWDESIGGAATSVHSSTNANVVMTVTASAADFVIRQTKQRFNYQPGKSQLVFMTFRSPQSTGVLSRIGLFSGTGVNNLTPNNGVFFECDGDLAWKIAKNGTVTESATQANWNVDTLDGTGLSGVTFDPTAAQIAVIDYEWLGVGRVRVGFVIDGIIRYCHYFNHANDPSFTTVYTSSPNLPLRYSVESDGTGGGTLDHICSTVMSEGGLEETGVLRVADTGLSYVTTLAANTDHAIVGIRLKAAYNDITVLPERVSVISGTNDNYRWSLHLNPVVAGTFTYNDLLNSAVQAATGTAANTITTPGVVIASGFSRAGGNVDSALNTALKIGSTIAGALDTLVLCISPFGSNASIAAGLNFRELL